MQTIGTRRLLANPIALHQVLDSAAKLESCLPKCDSFTGSIADGYDFAMSQSVGPLTVTFRGRATFARAVVGRGYVLDIVGSSRLTGQITARVTLALTPRLRATLMDYEATLDPSVTVKLFRADRIERAFAAGIGAFADRLKAAAEKPQT